MSMRSEVERLLVVDDEGPILHALQRTFEAAGYEVTACHTLLALELAGFPAGKLYVGSWSDWSSQPAASVATGPEPG